MGTNKTEEMILQLSRRLVHKQVRRTLSTSTTTLTKIQTAQEQTDHWLSFNKTSGRPMSPHLRVYKWSIAMVLSSLNRITGFSLVVLFFALPLLDFLSDGKSAETIISFGQQMRGSTMGTLILLSVKCGIVASFVFHTLHGFRHFMWDLVAGKTLRNMKFAGFTGTLAVLATAGITAAACYDHKLADKFWTQTIPPPTLPAADTSMP